MSRRTRSVAHRRRDRRPAHRADDRRQLRRDGRAVPGPRGARRRRAGHAMDLGRAEAGRGRGGSWLRGRRHREGRPGRHLGAELRGVDHRPVRHGQDGRDPRQHQPRLPDPRAEVRPRPGRDPDDRGRAVVQDQRLRRDDRRGPRRRRRASSRSSSSARTAGATCSPAPTRSVRRTCADPGGPHEHRGDQHPVHVGHDRLPQGRHAEPPQHPQQRLLRRRAVPLHRGRPGLHTGALLPLLRHGHGQPRLLHPRGGDGHPGAGVRPGQDAAGLPGREGHVALRRPDDVHRRVVAAELRRLRRVERAHRDHGRLPVPGRADEEGHRLRDRRDDHLLRHDRDLTGVDADPHRRHLRPHGRHRRPGRAAPGDQGRRPGDRRDPAAR